VDGDQFDAMARRFGSRESRRRFLQSIAASAMGAVFVAIGRAPTWAAPDPCSTYCSRQEPKGPAQAACKQACKKCKANTTRVCRQETGYVCCPQGQECPAGVCCLPGRATCGGTGTSVCCPNADDTFCCFDQNSGSTVCPSAFCAPPRVAQGCTCVCDPPGRAECNDSSGNTTCCPDPGDTFCCFQEGNQVCPSSIDCGARKVRVGCECVCDPDLPLCTGAGEFRHPGDCLCTTCQTGYTCNAGDAVRCDPVSICLCTSVLEGGAACAGNRTEAIPCTSTDECVGRLGPGAICGAPGTGCFGQQCIYPCGWERAGVTAEGTVTAEGNTRVSRRSRTQRRSRKQHRSRKHHR
jgi:hypothetical protein